MDNTFNPPAEILFEQAPEKKFPWLNIALFVLTCLSTLIAGTVWTAGFTNSIDSGSLTREIWRTPSLLFTGLPFSLAIMSILLAHEMGHYLTCRYYGISASLPYFIPAPPLLIGTMGAFIRIRSPIHHRAALLEVGIAGPIAGFVLAVPALLIALPQSRFIVPDPAARLGFGEPLIFKLLEFLMGKVPPPGMDLALHPVGLAAWFGFFVTALNLLPVGQLDGGHIAYALFGRVHKRISQGFLFSLIPLGIFYWQGWLVWTTLLLLIGLRHPVTLDDSIPLRRRHIWLGWIALALLVVCFTPMPFYLTEP